MKNKNITLTVVLIIFLLIFIILTGITYNTIKQYSYSNTYLESVLKFQEENEENVFSIDKITYFSSCDAKIETNSNSSFTISDLFQYTDIAIFINPNSDKLTPKNTLKSVSLDNITFSLKPIIGTPSLYYKNINEFATPKFSKENAINNSITFETTSKDTIDYTKPVLYNNCANPISLCYVNSNLQEEYTLENTISKITHNVFLLKKFAITTKSISCNISLDMNITNNLDEVYNCPITLNVPLSTEKNTIYDGSLTLKDMVNYIFIKH